MCVRAREESCVETGHASRNIVQLYTAPQHRARPRRQRLTVSPRIASRSPNTTARDLNSQRAGRMQLGVRGEGTCRYASSPLLDTAWGGWVGAVLGASEGPPSEPTSRSGLSSRAGLSALGGAPEAAPEPAPAHCGCVARCGSPGACSSEGTRASRMKDCMSTSKVVSGVSTARASSPRPASSAPNKAQACSLILA